VTVSVSVNVSVPLSANPALSPPFPPGILSPPTRLCLPGVEKPAAGGWQPARFRVFFRGSGSPGPESESSRPARRFCAWLFHP